MRTHKDIAKQAGAEALIKATGASSPAVRSWILRGRIAPEYWHPLAKAKLATLDELAKAAADNPRKSAAASEQAAAA